MNPWHRPVKSHILNRARPRWKNTQSIFPKICHISPFSLFFPPSFFFLFPWCECVCKMLRFCRHVLAAHKHNPIWRNHSSPQWTDFYKVQQIMFWLEEYQMLLQTPPEKGFVNLQLRDVDFHRLPPWILQPPC